MVNHWSILKRWSKRYSDKQHSNMWLGKESWHITSRTLYKVLHCTSLYIKSYYMMNSDEWTLDPEGDFFPCCRVNANGSSIKQENPQLSLAAPLDRAKPCVQIDGQHANAISKSMSVNHVHGSHHTWAQWECSANMWRRVGGQYVQVWSSTNPFHTTILHNPNGSKWVQLAELSKLNLAKHQNQKCQLLCCQAVSQSGERSACGASLHSS